ncbi:SCF ubiquitin ligase complex subunit [Umbelopsis sp. WA50703]
MLPFAHTPDRNNSPSPTNFGSTPSSASSSVTSLSSNVEMDKNLISMDSASPAYGQCLPSEIIHSILKQVTSMSDVYSCSLVCKAWCYMALEVLWFKPGFQSTKTLSRFCSLLRQDPSTMTFLYPSMIRRLNLSNLSEDIDDAVISCLAACNRLERITLAGCTRLTDNGILSLLQHSVGQNLISVDLSDMINVTDTTIFAIAEKCPKLQGLNLSMCKDSQDPSDSVQIHDESIIRIAERCPSLRRIKLSNCVHLTDRSAIALATHCRVLLEIDLMNCKLITNAALVAIFRHCSELREFRINQCKNITDTAFTQSVLASKPAGVFHQLRILDLTSVSTITDQSVAVIVEAAPKIRNLILNKCENITDESVFSICKLGRHLHYLHLGHCDKLTDRSIIQLAHHCMRIRYLDLACCVQLTDRAVMELAILPKLKRIGLVKCHNITDDAIFSLTNLSRMTNSLERVHLSYCVKLTEQSITHLVSTCQRLTHLSLTGVPPFLRRDFQHFCRPPPRDFNAQQRSMFCVFSGKGVRDLRAYFNRLLLLHGDIAGTEPHTLQDFHRPMLQSLQTDTVYMEVDGDVEGDGDNDIEDMEDV